MRPRHLPGPTLGSVTRDLRREAPSDVDTVDLVLGAAAAGAGLAWRLARPVLLVTGAVLYWFFGDPDTWVYIAAVTVIMLLLTPPSFRYARAVMLYAFGGISFDKRYLEKNKR